jgi:hypothetical protein
MDTNHELLCMADDPKLVVSVECAHGVYRAFLGDKRRGYRVSRTARSFDAAVRWLQRQARRCYPRSRYVQTRRAPVKPSARLFTVVH